MLILTLLRRNLRGQVRVVERISRLLILKILRRLKGNNIWKLTWAKCNSMNSRASICQLKGIHRRKAKEAEILRQDQIDLMALKSPDQKMDLLKDPGNHLRNQDQDPNR